MKILVFNLLALILACSVGAADSTDTQATVHVNAAPPYCSTETKGT